MNAQQLRNSILQQAIQGKLVPQDPADEPASVLLQRIRKEKECLVKEGKLKKKDLESKPIEEDEIPFEIPNGWAFCRLGDLGDYRKGPFGSSLTKSMFVPKSETSVKVYEQKNAIQKDWRLGEYYISSAKYETMKSFTVLPGDIIVSCAGTIGETYFLPNDAVLGIINQALMRVKLFDNQMVLYWQLLFDYVMISNTKMKGNGSAIKNIPPFEILKNIVVPLPPLAEQRRIVAKIEELMPLVERYGKAQEELNQLNESLPARLRQSILQEAIQGRLVPQDPKEEPVDSLLAEIKNKKEQLWQRQEIKKNSLLSIPIEEDEVEYSIPDSWRYVRLQDVCTCIFSGKSPKYSQTPTIHKIIGQQSNQWNGVEMRFVKYGTEEFAKSISQIQYLQDHDVLLNTLGNGTLGRSGIYYTSYSETPVLTDGHIFVLRTLYEATAKYILAYLRVKFVDINRSADGSTNQTFLNLTKTAKWIIPLPPLAEQRRIVSRIEELFEIIKK